MLSSVCPECGSGKIQPSEGEHKVSCTACKATFDKPSAVDIEVDGSVDTAQAIYEEVAQGLFQLIYQNAAKPLGAAIMGSGVVDVGDTEAFTHLIKAACMGAHKAILKKAEELGQAAAAKEKKSGKRN